MFCDQVSVTLVAGSGGDGCMSFRREKYVSRGGPDGGNGGRGGHIILKVNPNLNSLIDFRKQKIYTAEAGRSGHRFDKAGRAGEELLLDVPSGTLVFNDETNELLVDLIELGQSHIVLEGGRGGFGNAHFVSSVRQAPDFAEKGEPGHVLHVRLEMRMVAEVGIIGLPSVGKSTLISRITDARPKIADYPFTTLIPNMGVVDLARFGGTTGQSFVVADIPGLIEGAHFGKGLGDEFLRHISRTAVLVHVLDCQSLNLSKDYNVILNELNHYDPALVVRPQLVVLNKIDTIDDETLTLLTAQLKSELNLKTLYSISAVSGKGLKEFVFALWTEVWHWHESIPEANLHSLSQEDYRVFRPHLEKDPKRFEIVREKGGFRIYGPRLEQIVVMSDLENKMALERIYDVMEKMGVLKELRRLKPFHGDPIFVGEGVFLFRG